MSEKNIKSRIVHKHDTEINWLKATNFIPKQGEIIIYDVDDNYNYERLKIGDGVTSASELPFIDNEAKSLIDSLASNIPVKVSQLENDLKFTSEEQVESLYKKLNSNTVLGFYCIEDVTVVVDGVSTVYPANSNVEVKLLETDTFEIIPTSNNSILALNAFPGALGTYYPWLEGVKQFSNILFDMNAEDMYTKWNQGNQGAYQVQYAQYVNCIFWSDNPYISELSKRTNYTLYYSSQLPLCYSTIPDNTFKAFYLAFGVNNDPNWGNQLYRDSFAKATWATQVFSYYGARTIGIFGHDDPDFNIVLPKDCRGLMSAATAIENAGTFDAINVTNFGAKSGSWRDAFGWCSSLRNLYIKNLKVNLNISWSPINYDSISFIISEAINASKITISVSPYTYNLLGPSDFELAASKNIAIELITANYIEDKRLSAIANKQDKLTGEAGQFIQIDENGNAVAVDLEIPASEQSDWQENDVNSPAYVKNRTHWTELSYDIAFPVQNITIANDSIDLMGLPMFNKLTPGAICKVTIGDDAYEVEARHSTYNAYEWYVLGNGSLIGEGDTGEDVPFGIFIDKYEENYASCTGYNGTVQFGIEVINEVVHKIPEMYLPETIGRPGTGSYSNIFNNTNENIASNDYSHAENFKTKATGYASHAEGMNTEASGYGTHAEGNGTVASAPYSHAEGWNTVASASASHASGLGTIASGEAQTVVGKYNAADTMSLFIVGKGSSDEVRRNAFVVTQNGDGHFAGNVYANNQKLATESYVETNISDKKEKDLIVTYREDSRYFATHSVTDIMEAVNNGRTVKFEKDAELLNLLEVTSDFATFYIVYVNMNNKLQQKIVALSGDTIMLEQDDTYDYATNAKFNNYYTKTEADKKIADLVDSAPETLNTLGELATALQDNVEVVDALNEAIANKANTSDVLIKAEQTLTDAELAQVRTNLRFIGKNLRGNTYTIDGVEKTASDSAEIFGDYENNIAIGQWSIAEGSQTKAIGRASHAEGALTQAVADGTHTEGYGTKATGYWSHAEGEYTVVSSYASHAEGSYTKMPDGSTRYGTASGYASHVEGGGSHATGTASHAEGIATTAGGRCAHSEGVYTIASGKCQHVEGNSNIEDVSDKYIHIAGNGASPTDRSNAYTLDWNGNGWFANTIKVGGTNQDDENAKEVATKEYVDSKEPVSLSVDMIDQICI